MRVLHVLSDPRRRGAQVFAVGLAQALERRGADCAVAALARRRVDGRAGGDLPVETLGPRSFHPATLAVLRRRGVRADVVVAHGSRALPACALALDRTPLVYRSIGDIRYWTASPGRRVRTTLALRRATAVVALWSRPARDLSRWLRVPAERVHVIPNGVSADGFEPGPTDRSAPRAALGLAADRPTLAYVGALAREKRIDTIVRAVARTDAQLVVAGDGPERRRLEALGAELLDGRVRFLGHVPDVRGALRAADLFVLASVSEGQPGALIEAGLAGLGTVATAVGGVPEIVEDGVSGLLVPAGDPEAMAAAITDALPRAARLGRAARRRALECFELGAVADRYHDLLEAVTTAAAARR